MIIIGFVVMVAGLFAIIGTFTEDRPNYAARALSVVILCVGILGIVYNFVSPIVVESEKFFVTNNYQFYGLNVDSERVGVVKEVQYDSLFPLALLNEPTKYYFVDFVGE